MIVKQSFTFVGSPAIRGLLGLRDSGLKPAQAKANWAGWSPWIPCISPSPQLPAVAACTLQVRDSGNPRRSWAQRASTPGPGRQSQSPAAGSSQSVARSVPPPHQGPTAGKAPELCKTRASWVCAGCGCTFSRVTQKECQTRNIPIHRLGLHKGPLPAG